MEEDRKVQRTPAGMPYGPEYERRLKILKLLHEPAGPVEDHYVEQLAYSEARLEWLDRVEAGFRLAESQPGGLADAEKTRKRLASFRKSYVTSQKRALKMLLSLQKERPRKGPKRKPN